MLSVHEYIISEQEAGDMLHVRESRKSKQTRVLHSYEFHIAHMTHRDSGLAAVSPTSTWFKPCFVFHRVQFFCFLVGRMKLYICTPFGTFLCVWRIQIFISNPFSNFDYKERINFQNSFDEYRFQCVEMKFKSLESYDVWKRTWWCYIISLWKIMGRS